MVGSLPALELFMSLKIVRRLLPDFGTTYGPPGDGPFPAVMILHGSEGACGRSR